MVKHTQTICWQLLTNCLSMFDHFVELALKGLIAIIIVYEFFLKIHHQFLSLITRYLIFFATISNLQTVSSERTTLQQIIENLISQ